MKTSIFTLLLLFILGPAIAQKKLNIYFLKKNDVHVAIRDSADYIRVVQEADSDKLYEVEETYKNGKLKSKGMASKFEPAVVYEGEVTTYHENGNKASIFNYKAGEAVGLEENFHINGVLKSRAENFKVAETGSQPKPINTKRKLIYYADSLGKVMVENGNGHYVDLLNRHRPLSLEEGDYKDGSKHGLWKGKDDEGRFWYKEVYDQGRFVSGESSKEGKSMTYKEPDTQPGYKGGMEKFYKYLSNEIDYPRDARKLGVEGKVFLRFVVEKDGEVTDVKVTRSVFPSIDKEAVRVLLKSPKWSPGTLHGFPVRVQYNLPLSFRLN